MLAVGVILSAVFGYASDDLGGFVSNLAAEFIGIAGAFAVAWFFIERRFQMQADRVNEAVRSRLDQIRNEAANQVARITQEAYNDPPFNQPYSGINIIRQRYDYIRDLVDLNNHQPEWPFVDQNNPSQIAISFSGFGNLITMINRAHRMFGPALMEYPALLQAFEEFEFKQSSEEERWKRFWEEDHAEDQRREMEIRHFVEGESPQPREFAKAPEWARNNLLVLASAALNIIVTVTMIIRDWDVTLPEHYALAPRAIFSWTYPRRSSSSRHR